MRPLIFLTYLVGGVCVVGLTCSFAVLNYCYKKSGWPTTGERSNCAATAIPLFLRDGGYLVITKSAYAPLPRFMHATQVAGTRTHFTPLHPKRGWKAVLHTFWFKGKLVKKES